MVKNCNLTKRQRTVPCVFKKTDEEGNEKRSGEQSKDGMLPRYGKFNIKKLAISLIVYVIIIISIFFIKKQITFEVFILVGIVCSYTIVIDIFTYSEFYKIKNRVVTIRKFFSKKRLVFQMNWY